MATRNKATPKHEQPPAGKSLVVVESPAKAKTISRYLGRDYVVKASMGHVRDLPQRGFGVDVDYGFRPHYEVLDSRRRVVGELKKAAQHAPKVYLATDLDREGEAIAWHLAQTLNLPADKVRRVIFNEITAPAIRQAFADPKAIDLDKVNAQQARRVLDRIVGYELSPLLWKKIAKGLSAGRVQSVAVRLVVDRENEIRRFAPEEFWRLTAYLTPGHEQAEPLRQAWRQYLEGHRAERTRKQDLEWLAGHECLRAELIELGGKPFKPADVDEARRVVAALGWQVSQVKRSKHPEYGDKGFEQVELVGRLELDRVAPYTVASIERKRTTTHPPAPFITATLQQAASTQLRFSTSKTMRVAQALYEGMDIGEEGPVGLITYMRTDSTNLANEAVAASRQFIGEAFGAQYVPARPNVYRSKSGAQEAHEAVRPTDVRRTPESLKGKLTGDHFRLYELIWKRFVACQMKPAEWDSTVASIVTDTPQGEALLKAGGRRLVFDGFLRVMGVDNGADQVLPALAEGQRLAPLELEPTQHFTSPPPRYNEASLVKALEAEGIGRPSTYAAIIQTIQGRGYVEQKERKFYATPLGEVVTGKLLEHFPKIMDVKFTSHMESLLDDIEESHLDWVNVLREFYEPFKVALERAEREMQVTRGAPSPHACPECSKPLAHRWGKNGRFLGCTGYPECKYTCNVDREGNPIIASVTRHACERCGKPMILRQAGGGYFLGCSGYPECDLTVPCDERGDPLRKVTPDQIRETCDECGQPMQVKWKGRQAFLGCSAYPQCRGTRLLPPGLYVEPRRREPPQQAGLNCPDCGKPMVIRKAKGKRGPFVACSGYPKCRKTMSIEKIEALKAGQASAAGGPAAQAAHARNDPGLAPAAPGEPRAAGAQPADGQAPKGKVGVNKNGKMVVESLDGPIACPLCGSRMQVRSGRFGPFMACTGYPRCKATARLKGKAVEQARQMLPERTPRPKPEQTDIACPACGSTMVVRMSRRGRFLGCGSYPKCKHTMELPAELAERVRRNLEQESAGKK